mmetsp:Transcript_37740/g.61379  ORF Transcript_37740/g.61379 Transcript_37740/m.61379 type:complete len:390 (-) Transcript_37740:352-1521(-)
MGMNLSTTMEAEDFRISVSGQFNKIQYAFQFLHMVMDGVELTEESILQAKEAWGAQYDYGRSELSVLAMDSLCDVISNGDPRVALPSPEIVQPLTRNVVEAEMEELLAPSNMEVQIVGRNLDEKALEEYAQIYLGSVKERYQKRRHYVDPSFNKILPDTTRRSQVNFVQDVRERAAVVLGQIGPNMNGDLVGEVDTKHDVTGVWTGGSDSKFSSETKEKRVLWRRSHPLYVPTTIQILELLANAEIYYKLRDQSGVAYSSEFEYTLNRRHSGGMWTLEVSTQTPLYRKALDMSIKAISTIRFNDVDLLSAKAYLLDNYSAQQDDLAFWVEMMRGLQDDTVARDIRCINEYEKLVKSITLSDLYDVWGSFNTSPSQILASVALSGETPPE